MMELAKAWGPHVPLDFAAERVVRQVRDHAIFMVDRQGRAASWNEGVEHILGWDETEWLGQPLGVAFTDEDAAAGLPEQELRDAEWQGRADDDRWMKRRNGERFLASGSVTPIRSDAGELVGFLKVLRDGTTARQAHDNCERALEAERVAHAQVQHQAAVLRATVDAIPDAMYLGNAEGITECNPQALALLGASSLQDFQANIGELRTRFRVRREIDGDLIEPDELPFARALKGETVMMETWATKATGENVLIRGTAAPIRVGGEIVGAVAINSDLTPRVQLEEKRRELAAVKTMLRARDEEFRALVRGVRDYAIFTVGLDGRISSWHIGAQLMKGYTADEAIGMPFAQLFLPEQRAAGQPEREMKVAATTGEYKGEGKRLRKNGEIFEAAVVLTALHGPDGEPLGYLKLTQDITDRKRLDAQRDEMLRNAEAARADAERVSHSMGEFLATISHELRTPLGAILGWSHLLERGISDPEGVKHGLAAITRNARVQVQLIEDLLDMNRIESGQLRLEMQPVELAGVVGGAVEAVLPGANTRNIAVSTVIDANAGRVMADPARLQQIVWNLLSNAVKFTPQGGRVTVSVNRRGNNTVEISVTDTGQGMEKSFIPRAFDRFQQQDASNTRRHGGLGLGLAIVRQLALLHGGSVHASSPGLGQGSTFTVCLPAMDAPIASQPASAQELVPSVAPGADDMRLAGSTVLLIDDAPDGRSVASFALRAAGAEVITAANAEEGLQRFCAQRPSAIVCDIGMPVHDGYEFIRWVREIESAEGRQTPAAAFTAYARPEDQQRALQAGYQAHLVKPLGPTELVEAVSALLNRRDGGPTGLSGRSGRAG